jgi:hypothetical protein
MAWWAWLVSVWAALAVAAALWLGAAAQRARGRERAARRHQYESEAGTYQHWWGRAG